MFKNFDAIKRSSHFSKLPYYEALSNGGFIKYLSMRQ
jgi:hypothetical protein